MWLEATISDNTDPVYFHNRRIFSRAPLIYGSAPRKELFMVKQGGGWEWKSRGDSVLMWALKSSVILPLKHSRPQWTCQYLNHYFCILLYVIMLTWGSDVTVSFYGLESGLWSQTAGLKCQLPTSRLLWALIFYWKTGTGKYVFGMIDKWFHIHIRNIYLARGKYSVFKLLLLLLSLISSTERYKVLSKGLVANDIFSLLVFPIF